MGTITAQDRKRVKAEGFLSNNDGEHFSCRVITENGTLNANQLKNVSEVADKFGNGMVSFTSRMTVEIPGLQYDDIQAIKDYLAQENLTTGGTTSIRPVVACKGTVCTFGFYDTQALAKQIHKRFFEGYKDVTLPHKFKIGVGGCPNNCIKPNLNDFGIMGQHVPNFNSDLCRGCKKCTIANVCRMQVCTVENDKMLRDTATCNNCGYCIEKCPFGAVKSDSVLLKLFIGGRWGRITRHGSALSGLYTMEQAMDIIEKTILLYRDRGYQGERLASMVDRIGMDIIEEQLLKNTLIERKEEILNAALKKKQTSIDQQ